MYSTLPSIDLDAGNVESLTTGAKAAIFISSGDHLTQGIAILRFDDRGVKLSQGDYLSATLADFADDVESVIRRT